MELIEGVAHIITSEAEALGEPEVIIMTRADETGAANEIERWPLNPAYGFDGAVYNLPDHGWMPTREPHRTLVEPGYEIIDVIKAR